MDRREFLVASGLAGWPLFGTACAARRVGVAALETDIAIVGGGLGGVAAALAATRLGARVVLVEDSDWVGGQLTSQGVPPDEHRWIETAGATRNWRALRIALRDHYRRHLHLNAAARASEHLNPGAGWVSRLCVEPSVAHTVLSSMLAGPVAGGRLTLLLDTRVTGSVVEGDRVLALDLKSPGADVTTLEARLFLDATEEGDLLPLVGAGFVTGSESQSETGEAHASAEARPHNVQAFTLCFALEYRPGEDHRTDEPEGYAFWREYVPALAPPWPGPLLSLEASHPITLEPRRFGFKPTAPGIGDAADGPNLFTYRRVRRASSFEPGRHASDVTIVNWPQNDYLLGRLHEVSNAEREQHLARAKQLGRALVYWLQHEVPGPGGRQGWQGLRLCGEVMGTADGFAKRPYVRESRRIRSEFTVTEEHVAAAARMQATGESRAEVVAAPFFDSVGVGHYRIDLHPTTGGDNYVDLDCLRFQIPLGALLPRRVDNLVAAAKNIGTTHVTNGAYRLHPVEWNIGEAAGALAAFCLQRGVPPRAVRAEAVLLDDFQRQLVDLGVQLEW